jgi:ferredoxin-NADP reductase
VAPGKGKYDSKLLGSEEIAAATRAFHFEKPDGFAFTPGESIDLFLPEDFPGASDDRQRSFSLASAPHEDRLTIATRMRKSAYKQPLADTAPGAKVRIVGPTGTMSLHDEPDRAIVMIAGGIGITPFISVLRSEAEKESPRPMALLYSNRRPADAAYLDELRELEQRLDGFRLVLTMTGMKDSDTWDGETRRIDADMVQEAARDLPRPHYYIAGTPDMCEAMRQMLDDMGIEDDDIHSEDFTGYT